MGLSKAVEASTSASSLVDVDREPKLTATPQEKTLFLAASSSVSRPSSTAISGTPLAKQKL
jgi:hypothetical protein